MKATTPGAIGFSEKGLLKNVPVVCHLVRIEREQRVVAKTLFMDRLFTDIIDT
jgi:hypothetical protein